MAVELKPCPFCGATDGKPELDSHQGDKWGAVLCSCGVFGPEVRTGYDDSPNAPWHAEAIAAWNNRATQPPAVGVDVDYTSEEVDAVIDAATERGTRHVPVECIEQMRTVLHAALRTGGGES